jgi:predicted DCC family thiol-disulfide oxidoreductase YuxK
MSERYLLFDGGCAVCAALAREVETLSGGRLGVRSLRDPEVRALLDRARPGWRWEPMLLEIEGERVRVFTGLAMRWRLVQLLGPVRALRVAQVVARHGGPVLGVDWGEAAVPRTGPGRFRCLRDRTTSPLCHLPPPSLSVIPGGDRSPGGFPSCFH